MKHVISPQSIVLRLVQHASSSGLKLAEFRDVLVHMLDSTAHEHKMGMVINNIIKLDVLQVQVTKVAKMVRILCLLPPVLLTCSVQRSFVYRSETTANDPADGQEAEDSPISEEDQRMEQERRLRRLRTKPMPKMDVRSIVSIPTFNPCFLLIVFADQSQQGSRALANALHKLGLRHGLYAHGDRGRRRWAEEAKRRGDFQQASA